MRFKKCKIVVQHAFSSCVNIRAHTTIDRNTTSMEQTPQQPDPHIQLQETIKKEKSFFRELIDFALIALLIVLPFRIFIAQPFVVSGASMDPTFKDGEYLIVDQISYRFHTPERGSVLIFKYPKDTSKYFIKRVIGLPGETVEIKSGVVTIKNPKNPKGFSLNEPYIVYPKSDNFSTTLSTDEYFVMGDNRLGSADSRYWGPMPTQDIVGRPILRLFPISTAGYLPGDKRALLEQAQ